MKKGYYLIKVNSQDQDYLRSYGVMKKVLAQVKVLNDYFNTTLDVVNVYDSIPQTGWDKLKIRLPFTAVDKEWDYKESYKDADFIYMRRPNIDRSVIRLFKKIKKHSPSTKIIFEIPTYPYIPEIVKNGLFKELPFIIKDYVNHNLLRKYVDLITTFSPDTKIWGIKALPLKNGVDFSSISMPLRQPKDNTIEVIEVSCPNYWHGYDRFLAGMGEYYKKGGTRNIIFHMVGEGMAVPQYHKLVKEYQLEEHVVIYGNKSGDELNEIYKRSFLGLDGLARHRSGNLTNSSLKSREYAAMGIPFVSSVDIDFAEKDWPYLMQVPQDETPIDMNKVIEFYDKVYSSRDCNEVANEIRTYAESRCDMKVVMQPLVEYIKE